MILLLAVLPARADDDDGARFTRFLGLRLNVGTLDDVQARLGKARLHESWDGESGQHSFESEQKMTAGDRSLFRDSPELLSRGSFNVIVTVTGEFSEGRLVMFRVWKIVTA